MIKKIFLILLLINFSNNISSMQSSDLENNRSESENLEQNALFLNLPEEIIKNIIDQLIDTSKIDNLIKKIKNTNDIFKLYSLNVMNFKNSLMNFKNELIENLKNVLLTSWQLRYYTQYYVNRLIKNYKDKLENTFKEKEQEFINKIKDKYGYYPKTKLNIKLKSLLNSVNINRNALKVAAKLIIAGADINKKNRYGETTLMWTVIEGCQDILELLLNNEAIEVNIQDNLGQTTLMWAMLKGHKNIIKRLLNDKNIDVNIQDSNGETALIWATIRGYKDIVKLLLNHKNIKIDLKNENGETALMIAEKFAYTNVVYKDIAKLIELKILIK